MASTNPAPTDSAQALAEKLQQQEYLRERLQPKPSDIEYLVHQDLRDVVTLLCRDLKGRLLDYGCGGSPYATILPQFSPYVRADIGAAPGIDLVLNERGELPAEPDGSFDVILSTQVLEHVPDPEKYLAEAFRLLRPGGAMVITTHGFVPEHGCPDDYHRWTGYGLERVMGQAGFVVEESYKTTAMLRASVYLLHFSIIYQLSWPTGKVLNYFLYLVRMLYLHVLVAVFNYLGSLAAHQSRVSSHDDVYKLYIGVAMRVRKPQ
jgi:SAM-dependent methyltransferase